jgi:hypothetical protein
VLIPQFGVRSYALLSRPPLEYPRRGLSARLACIRHAASVHPEPGSNSPIKNLTLTSVEHPVAIARNLNSLTLKQFKSIDVDLHYLIFKAHFMRHLNKASESSLRNTTPLKSCCQDIFGTLFGNSYIRIILGRTETITINCYVISLPCASGYSRYAGMFR